MEGDAEHQTLAAPDSQPARLSTPHSQSSMNPTESAAQTVLLLLVMTNTVGCWDFKIGIFNYRNYSLKTCFTLRNVQCLMYTGFLVTSSFLRLGRTPQMVLILYTNI